MCSPLLLYTVVFLFVLVLEMVYAFPVSLFLCLFFIFLRVLVSLSQQYIPLVFFNGLFVALRSIVKRQIQRKQISSACMPARGISVLNMHPYRRLYQWPDSFDLDESSPIENVHAREMYHTAAPGTAYNNRRQG